MEKDIYSIGIDYGTRSARALLVNITSGAELGYIQCKYPHDIIKTELPTGEKLRALIISALFQSLNCFL